MIQAAETSSMQECMLGSVVALSEKSSKRGLKDPVRQTIEDMLRSRSRRKPMAWSAQSNVSAPPAQGPPGGPRELSESMQDS